MSRSLKLNPRGFAHHFLLALIVVGVAIGGTYYLVRSFADTCGSPATSEATSGPASAPTSGPASVPTSGPSCVSSEPTTEPASAPASVPSVPTYAVACSITPSFTTVGKAGSASVTVTNNGKAAVTPKLSFTYSLNGRVLLSKTGLGVGQLLPSGKSKIATLTTALLTPASAGSYVVAATVLVPTTGPTRAFTCSKTFAVTAPITYAASCSISGVPGTVKKGSAFTASVTVRNSGSGTLSGVSVHASSVGGAFSIGTLTPGRASSRTYGRYTVAKSTTAKSGSVAVSGMVTPGGKSFGCSTSYSIVK